MHEEVGFTLPTRLYAHQREQGQTQITYFDQHSMQSRLINYWAREDGFSIVHHSDGQSIKPLRPFTVKMPLDDNLVDLLSIVFAFHLYSPCLPSCSLTVKRTSRVGAL